MQRREVTGYQYLVIQLCEYMLKIKQNININYCKLLGKSRTKLPILVKFSTVNAYEIFNAT